MVLGTIVGNIAGQIIRRYTRTGLRYVYQGLRIQDRLISRTYRKAGLYNRRVVRGIQHGLIAGQVIGGTLNLGLPGNIENGLPEKSRKLPPSRTQYKTRSRYKYNSRRSNQYGTAGFCKRCRQSCPCKCWRRPDRFKNLFDILLNIHFQWRRWIRQWATTGGLLLYQKSRSSLEFLHC